MSDTPCPFCADTGIVQPGPLDHLAEFAKTPYPDKAPKPIYCLCVAGRRERDRLAPIAADAAWGRGGGPAVALTDCDKLTDMIVWPKR